MVICVGKTNAIRILEKNKIQYEELIYEASSFHNGVASASKLNLNLDYVYKTIVVISKSKNYYTLVLPVAKELDLKKCAKYLNEKNLELININDMLKITGYIRGGCSPIGMKKNFKTLIDNSAQNKDYIYVSGGKIGLQIKISPLDLNKILNIEFKDICEG